jgi:hypothetical protein
MEPKDSLTELQVGTDKQRGDDISWCFESWASGLVTRLSSSYVSSTLLNCIVWFNYLLRKQLLCSFFQEGVRAFSSVLESQTNQQLYPSNSDNSSSSKLILSSHMLATVLRMTTIRYDLALTFIRMFFIVCYVSYRLTAITDVSSNFRASDAVLSWSDFLDHSNYFHHLCSVSIKVLKLVLHFNTY